MGLSVRVKAVEGAQFQVWDPWSASGVRMEDPWTFPDVRGEALDAPKGVDLIFKLTFPPLSSRGHETPADTLVSQTIHEALIFLFNQMASCYA